MGILRDTHLLIPQENLRCLPISNLVIKRGRSKLGGNEKMQVKAKNFTPTGRGGVVLCVFFVGWGES